VLELGRDREKALALKDSSIAMAGLLGSSGGCFAKWDGYAREGRSRGMYIGKVVLRSTNIRTERNGTGGLESASRPFGIYENKIVLTTPSVNK
jgi:hypothetical protein